MNSEKVLVSILILTHKRPHLFKRCIKSVLTNKPEWAEIIVNNDSNDINEIKGAKYYYKKHDDLSRTYNYLWDKASGKYIYYLEDDDYVVKNFWKALEDGIVMAGKNNICFKYIPYRPELYFKWFNEISGGKYSVEELLNKINIDHYQLGQTVFLKEGIDKFVTKNKLENDLLLLKGSKIGILYIPIPIYIQTIDGGDNISWEKLCTDARFKIRRKNV
jgi:glycosyltransferase involved in cell wall biosynthesis